MINLRVPVSRLSASFLSASILATCSAMAQNGPAVDRLLGGDATGSQMRSVSPKTSAPKRYAVVIGNDNYSAIPALKNAQADAEATATFLQSQGYEVQHYENLTKRGFEHMLRRVLFEVDSNTEVAVFFAGHGFQIGSENYLVPVDADLDSIYDVPFEAVSLGSLVGIIGARARLQVVILDSCRDNPFAGKEALTRIGNELRETRTGFSSQAAPLNSMLIYSTSPGSIAYDGDGENSPFTASLIQQASAQPDALVKDVFEDVRRDVYERTNGRQVPWDSSTLIEPASFGIGAALSVPIPVDGQAGGESRGLARISTAPKPVETNPDIQPVLATNAVLDAEFVPEVDIGFALRNALDLTPVDQITVTKGPKTGRLVLPDNAGFQRNVEGLVVSSEDIDRLLLINVSQQIPAMSVVDGVIQDSITVQVNGAEKVIGLSLAADQCDFQAGDHLDPGGMGLTRYANELQPEIALAACEASIARDPNVGRYHYQLGRALVALKRNDEAKVAFERARDLGHVRAWNALANAKLNETRETGGNSDPRANEDVLELFARGVEAGDPYAYYSLGRQFMRFGGTPEIEIEGYDLMMRALEVGHTFAMNELGYFYLDESGEYHDPERGLRYLNESAARDDIYGFNNMGIVYLRGLGGAEKDFPAAFDMFVKAAEGGHPNGAANVGWMYLEGQAPGGVDNTKAVKWFAEGLARGDARSGEAAGWLIANKNVEGYDRFDAAIFAAKGAALTNQDASAGALNLLKGLDRKTVAGGTQKLIVELGGEVTVDGAFGPGSQAAMDALLAKLDAGPAASDPIERILQLAALTWTMSPFRVDLY